MVSKQESQAWTAVQFPACMLVYDVWVIIEESGVIVPCSWSSVRGERALYGSVSRCKRACRRT